MYVRITYPKIQAFTNAGVLAVGYEVHTYLAGGTTPATTYNNRDLAIGHANPNPVILNARGEADIYTGVALKLVFTVPGGDPSSPIWSVDYVGEQQGTVTEKGTATGFANNIYTVNITPPYTSIPDMLSLVMMPDATNYDTITYPNKATAQVFAGTGIDDLIWSGPYTGTSVGAVYEVQIDGTQHQGAGLNDVTWGGTPLVGHVYTVTISTAAATDKFKWRKDGGAWSAEISITGAAQALTDGATVKFAATTGHTLNDIWNNVDTFKWRVDAGAYTAGVVITMATQTLSYGIKVKFAENVGHTLADTWTLTVMTPARLNFSGLGNKDIYKNVAGTLQALDGGDIVVNFPAHLDYSLSQGVWVLINPSLPVLTSLIPSRNRKELITTYTITIADTGTELSCFGTFVLNLPSCPTVPNTFYWVKRWGPIGGVITITTSGAEKIYGPGDTAGSTTFTLTDALDAVQLITNGVNWHIVAVAVPVPGLHWTEFKNSGSPHSWVVPGGRTIIHARVIGSGASGGGGSANPGEYGGGGGGSGNMQEAFITVVPGETLTMTVAANGAQAAVATDGNDGGISSIKRGITTLLAADGGHKGIKGSGSAGTGGLPGGASGDAGTNGAIPTGGTGGKNRPAQVLGNWGAGGNGGDQGSGSGTAATDGYILIDY